jgi:hypothetical protein
MSVISLEHTLDPVITHFNTLQSAPRLVAPLSPTCPGCLFGAEAIRQVVEAVPELQALFIWLPMLADDSPATTEQSAKIYAHPRIQSFADPARRAGRHIAGRLGGGERMSDGDRIAWDCYLFYPQGVIWEHDLPLPDQWFHQLDAQSADPALQRCGPRLLPTLLENAQRLVR